jgi:hypothetical protein
MDFKIVAAKVDSKSDAQRAYREIEDAQDAGTTDFQEVLGIWKNEKGTVRSKYYGNHARSVGTGVGLLLGGPVPAVIGYFVGRHVMPKNKILTPFLEDLDDFVDRDGAAIFVLAAEDEVDALVDTISKSNPQAKTDVLDPDVFRTDLAVMEQEATAAGA